MFKVVTRYQTNASGRSQILAKGEGKQVTHNFDQSKSFDWNHGTAAGALLVKLGMESDADVTITHSAHDNSHHIFNVG